MIFSKKELSDKIDFAVFPSLQGGPHNNVIAAVAVALKEAMDPSFNEYILNVLDNSKVLASHMIEKGYTLSTGGTENHLMLIDLRDKKITGSKVEYILEKVNISVNKNAIVGDKSALSPGGIRIGLCAMTTRGVERNDCQKIAEFIDRAITIGLSLQEGSPKLIDFKNKVHEELSKNDSLLQKLKDDVIQFTERLQF